MSPGLRGHASLITAVKKVSRSWSPELPLPAFVTMKQLLASSLDDSRFYMRLLAPDVSAREISVARMGNQEETPTIASFANNGPGHTALVTFLLQGKEHVRVCLEARGNYSIDLALLLDAHRHVEVSLVNPRRARRFAESLGERSKTDPVDARVLCQYAARMPWEPWRRPTATALLLRAITRAIENLGVMHTQERNRDHALKASQALPALLVREMQRHQRYLEHRIHQLHREARRLIAKDPDLDRGFHLMLAIRQLLRRRPRYSGR